MVWERAGRLAGLAGGRSGSPLAHSVGTCLHWASPGFSVGVGLIRGQKFSAASLGAGSCPIGLRNSGLLPKRWVRVRRIF